MMMFAKTWSSRVEGHLSGGQTTGGETTAVQAVDRRAGSVADWGIGDGGDHRAVRVARCGRGSCWSGWPQHSWQVRTIWSGWTATARMRPSGADAGGGVVLDDRGGVG